MRILLKAIILITVLLLVSCGVETIRTEETLQHDTEQQMKNEIVTSNPYFPYGKSAVISCDGKFCFDDLVEEQAVLQIDLVEKLDDGYIYNMHIDTATDLGGEENVFFYVTEDEIRIFWVLEKCSFENNCYDEFAAAGKENRYEYTTLVCACEDVDMSYDKVDMHIENSGDVCTFFIVNHGVETGFYQRLVFEKNVGITKYMRGFGAMRDHVEIDIQK